jgi:type VI secretion system protein VasJ
MRENLEKIEQFTQRHMDGQPSVSRIIDTVELLAAQLVPPSKDIQIRALPGPVVDEISGGSTSYDAPATEYNTSPQAAHRVMDNYLFRLREIAGFLRQQDPANPMVYRLNRHAVWINIDDLPPSANGKTRIPPPDNQTIKVLCGMRNNGNTEALLKFAEGKLCQYIFWLDLDRYVAEALVRLGDRYRKAHSVVCRETAFLLDRLPGLEDLLFSDGMPFASAETRVWITSIGLDSGRRVDEQKPVQQTPPEGTEDVIAREIGIARKLVKEGRLVEAMGNLHQELKRVASDRDRILWRIGVCQMLVEERQGRIALPHIELVLKDIDSYRLEGYEPTLALRALKLAWQGLNGQPEQEHKSRANDVLCRIARMDMAEALLMKISKGEDIWLRTRQ